MRKLLLVLGVGLFIAGGAWWLQAAQSRTARPVSTGAGTSSAPMLQTTNPPAVAAPTITPNIITVNTPTQVVATVHIPESTVTGVNLLRLNSNGSSTVVAQMVDNGQNGDATAGDKNFTARLTLNEPQAGEVRFQVSAAFRGVLRRVLSTVVVIEIWQRAIQNNFGITVIYPPQWTLQQATSLLRLQRPGLSADSSVEYAGDILIFVDANPTSLSFTDFYSQHDGGTLLRYAKVIRPTLNGFRIERTTGEAGSTFIVPLNGRFIRIEDIGAPSIAETVSRLIKSI